MSVVRPEDTQENIFFILLTAEDAEIAEETGTESSQFSVRPFVALEPACPVQFYCTGVPNVNGNTRICRPADRKTEPGWSLTSSREETSPLSCLWMPPYQVRGRLIESGMTVYPGSRSRAGIVIPAKAGIQRNNGFALLITHHPSPITVSYSPSL